MSTSISDQTRAGRESVPARLLPKRRAGGRGGSARVLRPRRVVMALSACLALSGCLDTPFASGAGGAFRKVENGGGLGIFSSLRRPMGPVLISAQAANGDVVIRGPEDYCIEGRSLKSDAERSFALLARCDILSGGEMGSPVALALLTATVTPYDAELPDAQALARDMAALEVLEYLDRGDVRLLHLGQGGDSLVRSADPRQWRAVFTLNGHAVTLAAYGPRDSAVAKAGGRSLLLAMARAIRAASPDSPGATTAELTTAAPEREDQSAGLGSTVNAPSMAEDEGTARE